MAKYIRLRDMNPTRALAYCANLTSGIWSKMESGDVLELWTVFRAYILNGYKYIDTPISETFIVGGGVGCAIAMPVAQEYHRLGVEVTSIIGFRNKDILILEDEFKQCSDRLVVMTDDGSYGQHGNVTVPLKEMLENGAEFDAIFAIGPLIMMKFVVETARPFGVPVTVSMNPVMIDGTGMCGGCRLTLTQNDKKVIKFACVDGPDFNGYEIDFDEAMSRARMYSDFERHAYEASCNLLNQQ